MSSRWVSEQILWKKNGKVFWQFVGSNFISSLDVKGALNNCQFSCCTLLKPTRRIMAIFTRLCIEISTKMHLLELSTVTHLLKKQINILNERPRDISLVPITWPKCRVYQSMSDVSVCYSHFSETTNPAPLFKQRMTKASYWIGILNKCLAASIKQQSIYAAYARPDECSKYLT